MKKSIAILCLWTIVVLLLTGLTYAQEMKVKVIVDTANVRLEPSLRSKIIRQVSEGTILEYKDKTGSWYFVSFPPDEMGFVVSGYIHEDVVEVVKEVEGAFRMVEPEERPLFANAVEVIAAQAELRLEPSLRSKVILQLEKGKILEFREKAGPWYFVSLPADERGFVISGYIHEDMIKIISSSGEIKEAPVTTVTQSPAQVQKEKLPVVPPQERAVYPPSQEMLSAKIGLGARAGYNMLSEEMFDSGLTYGGFLWFAFSKNIAIEVGGGMFTSAVEGDPAADKFSKGEISAIVAQATIQIRFPVGERLVPYIGVGGGYYLNKFTLDSEVESTMSGLGFSVEEEMDPAAGFHFGGGLDFYFSKNIALNIDAKYCSAKTKGTWSITDNATGIESTGEIPDVNLSSIVFGAGLKFCF